MISKWVELLDHKEEVTQRVFSKNIIIIDWISQNSEDLTLLKEMDMLEELSKKLFMIQEEELQLPKWCSEIHTDINNKLKTLLLLKECILDNTFIVEKVLI